MTEHLRLPIDGMTCTSCVAHITKAVRKVEGVESVKVELSTDSAVVGFDPEVVTIVDIAAAVARAGYEPRPAEAISIAAVPERGLLARLLPR